MIDNIFETHPDLFDVFQKDIWDKEQNVVQLEAALQNIADVIATEYGMTSPICSVKIANLNDPRKKGEFDYNTQELKIEKFLAVDKLKPPYYADGQPVQNVVSNRETLEILIHELRHAMQEYYRNNPSLHHDTEYIELISLNLEHKQNYKYSAYFENSGGVSALLYNLQPVERDAFAFAEVICKDVVHYMRERYPEDLSFAINSGFSRYQDFVDDAKIIFNTETPLQDIDNVIRHINNRAVHAPLNSQMWKAVEQTQTKPITQQIKERFSFVKKEDLGSSRKDYTFDKDDKAKTQDWTDRELP